MDKDRYEGLIEADILTKECNCRSVLETKTIAGLRESVSRLKDYIDLIFFGEVL